MSCMRNANQTAGTHKHHMGSAIRVGLQQWLHLSVHMHIWIYKAQERRFGRGERDQEGERGPKKKKMRKAHRWKKEKMEEEKKEKQQQQQHKTRSDVQQEVYGYSNEWGEPTASYRWTGWAWDITGWSSSRLQEYYSITRPSYFTGIYGICFKSIKEKPNDQILCVTGLIWKH